MNPYLGLPVMKGQPANLSPKVRVADREMHALRVFLPASMAYNRVTDGTMQAAYPGIRDPQLSREQFKLKPVLVSVQSDNFCKTRVSPWPSCVNSAPMPAVAILRRPLGKFC